MLYDVRIDNASHVCVVGRLVIVREESLASVVAAVVLDVIFALQVALELVIFSDLLVHLAQRGIVECFRVVSQHFGIVGVGEARVPFLSELQICLR